MWLIDGKFLACANSIYKFCSSDSIHTQRKNTPCQGKLKRGMKQADTKVVAEVVEGIFIEQPL
jgi:hypothetical protein